MILPVAFAVLPVLFAPAASPPSGCPARPLMPSATPSPAPSPSPPGSPTPVLAISAKSAYLHGMTLVLLATAASALLSAAFTALLMPGRPTPTTDFAEHEPGRSGLAVGQPDATNG